MAAGNRERRQQQRHLGAEEKIRDHMQGSSLAAMKGVCEACAKVVFSVVGFTLWRIWILSSDKGGEETYGRESLQAMILVVE